jgi:hypothetical protein
MYCPILSPLLFMHLILETFRMLGCTAQLSAQVEWAELTTQKVSQDQDVILNVDLRSSHPP